MAEVKIEDLQAKQHQLMALAQEMMNEPNGSKIAEMAPACQKLGQELEQLAKDFEAQQTAKYGVRSAGTTEIALTRDQKDRIKKATGLSLETVVLRDEGGIFARGMPSTNPQMIEAYAIKHAVELKLEQDSHEKSRVDLENTLSYLESLSPAHADEVRKLRADPQFAAILQKR